MSGDKLIGRRVLVMGASTGIGRTIGETLSAAGAHVAFASRRKALCEEVAKASKGTAVGLECDVTIGGHCERVVEETVESLGGLDDLVYSTGLISIIALADADESMWHRTLGTNVVGASLLTRAALPHLRHSRGTAVYLSSVSSTGGAWPGIGVYTSSKAALNRMIETWRCGAPRSRLHPDSRGPYRRCRDGSRVPSGSAAAHVSPWRAGAPLGRSVSSELGGGGNLARPGRGVADLGRDGATHGSGAPLAAL